MTVTTAHKTVDDESRAHGGFYVPRFELKIEGVGLPRDVLRDVIQVTYKDNVKEIDSVELQVNNWDQQSNDFKYVGSEPPSSGGGGSRNDAEGNVLSFTDVSEELGVENGHWGWGVAFF